MSSILPVVPDLKLMITGGVEPTQANMSAWFNAGAYCLGMGSHLFPKSLVNTNAWSDIRLRMQNAVQLAKSILQTSR